MFFNNVGYGRVDFNKWGNYIRERVFNFMKIGGEYYCKKDNWELCCLKLEFLGIGFKVEYKFECGCKGWK